MLTNRNLGRLSVPVALVGLLVLGGAGIASAHVTAHSPDILTKGGDAEIVFRVPNEQDAAGVVKLEIDFPTTTPIGDASTRPLLGWSATMVKTRLAAPVKMAKDTVTNAVQSITWTAQPGSMIRPGEFQEFAIAVEGLPTNTDQLVLPAVQTYDNGDVVVWDAPAPAAGQPEPEHPAPHVTLVAAGESDPANATGYQPVVANGQASGSDNTARWLGGTGLVIAALALGFGLGALVHFRREFGKPTDGVAASVTDRGSDSDGRTPGASV